MDPSSAFFRVIAGLATEKEQKMNGDTNQGQQPERRRSSISELVSAFSKMTFGGKGDTAGDEANPQNNSQSRKSIDKTNNKGDKKQENLEKARRLSIAILQTIRNAGANTDPSIGDNERQRQLDDAITMFQKMQTNDEFDWNDAFTDYNQRTAQQQTYKNQAYNMGYSANNGSYNNMGNYTGGTNQSIMSHANSNTQHNSTPVDDSNAAIVNSNIRVHDGRYDVENTTFVEMKHNENHGILDSIKSVTDNNENKDVFLTSEALQTEVARLRRENLILRNEIGSLRSDNEHLTQSKFQLINNMSQAMEQYRAMVRNYSKVVNGK